MHRELAHRHDRTPSGRWRRVGREGRTRTLPPRVPEDRTFPSLGPGRDPQCLLLLYPGSGQPLSPLSPVSYSPDPPSGQSHLPVGPCRTGHRSLEAHRPSDAAHRPSQEFRTPEEPSDMKK